MYLYTGPMGIPYDYQQKKSSLHVFKHLFLQKFAFYWFTSECLSLKLCNSCIALFQIGTWKFDFTERSIMSPEVLVRLFLRLFVSEVLTKSICLGFLKLNVKS